MQEVLLDGGGQAWPSRAFELFLGVNPCLNWEEEMSRLLWVGLDAGEVDVLVLYLYALARSGQYHDQLSWSCET